MAGASAKTWLTGSDKVTAAEHQIATLNAELAKLDKSLSDPLLFTNDPSKAASVSKKRAEAQRKSGQSSVMSGVQRH